MCIVQLGSLKRFQSFVQKVFRVRAKANLLEDLLQLPSFVDPIELTP